MRINWIALLVLALGAPAFGAEELARIEGQITDAGGVGVPGANISVKGRALPKGAGAVTDVEGHYVLSKLPPGTYILNVTHVGYKAVERRKLRLEPGQHLGLDIELESTIIFLEQNVVSASRTQEKVLDAPASVAVMEGREIRVRSALNVAENVKELPGVDHVQTGLNQSSTVVRGFNNVFSGALLTLTDNRIAGV